MPGTPLAKTTRHGAAVKGVRGAPIAAEARTTIADVVRHLEAGEWEAAHLLAQKLMADDPLLDALAQQAEEQLLLPAVRMAPVAAATPANPIAVPAAANRTLSRMTIAMIAFTLEPRASRIPNSRVRRAVRYASVP